MATATTRSTESGTDGVRRDPQRNPATQFGAALVALGVIDASGVLSNDERLLGIFRIPPSLNVVHVLTGLLGLVLSRYVGGGTLFNKVGGLVYAIVALGGVLSVLAGRDGVNWPTNVLHLVLAAVVGWTGFEGGKRRPS
ncbi:DUF4383 domain-containing protein [Natronococcus wangiae]|uniref:DUF4383 domain-containing protein n=1 Tax=Natronococcus wangiae TaxID=3068275 RepID=UPI00273FEE0A|nr:DUF4383 domain-containing protein [Natronococcus sp. AD5]